MTFDTHPGEHFVWGALLGFFVGLATTSMILYLDSHFRPQDTGNPWLLAGVCAGINVLLLLVRPVLERTLLRRRRNLFTLDVDLNQRILGRLVGLAAGVATGAMFASSWF